MGAKTAAVLSEVSKAVQALKAIESRRPKYPKRNKRTVLGSCTEDIHALKRKAEVLEARQRAKEIMIKLCARLTNS